MKYNVGDILYYVNPGAFNLEKVQIDFIHYEDNGTFYYVEQTGAYLDEADLHDDLDNAIDDALNRLNKYCQKRQQEILTCKPDFERDE